MAEQIRQSPLPFILSEQSCEADTRLLLFHERQILLHEQGRYFWRQDELARHGLRQYRCLPLSRDDAGLCAAVPLEGHLEARLPGRSVNIRELLLAEGVDGFSLVARGSQLSTWYRTHQYCGSCGVRTSPQGSQQVLACLRCALDYYPRINPCVIVLVTRGHDVLLARSARPGASFYSCLAGFMEIGETPEQSVLREVEEETGIRVRNIRYIRSQSWPFPSQLMLGFLADYDSGEMKLEPTEIADAGWYDVRELPVTPPPSVSVAGQLITHYRNFVSAQTY